MGLILIRIRTINFYRKFYYFFSELIEEVDKFFDREWQEKILLVEIIAFVILIFTAGYFRSSAPPLQWRHPRSTAPSKMSHLGILWTRNKKSIHRFIEYSTEHCNLKKEN